MTKRRLNFELVPDGCWHSNLRNFLSKEQWDYIKKDTKQRFDGKCAICGKTSKFLDAHEVWEYDSKKGVQKLKDVISVCKDCHSAIHIDFTAVKGDKDKLINAENKYMQVNQCSYVQMKKDLDLAHKKHKELNLVSEWAIDLGWLKRYINE